jgi:hypothetical protein
LGRATAGARHGLLVEQLKAGDAALRDRRASGPITAPLHSRNRPMAGRKNPHARGFLPQKPAPFLAVVKNSD